MLQLLLASRNRYALKYPFSLGHEIALNLQQPCLTRSTGTATVSKSGVTKTKKRYSELPPLYAQYEHPPDAVLGSPAISDTYITRQSSVSECALSVPSLTFATPLTRLKPSSRSGGGHSINILNSPSTEPLSLLPAAVEYESIDLKRQRTSKRRVRRIEAAVEPNPPEVQKSVERPNLGAQDTSATAKPKRGGKARALTSTGKSFE
jgi:hypothetical protein